MIRLSRVFVFFSNVSGDVQHKFGFTTIGQMLRELENNKKTYKKSHRNPIKKDRPMVKTWSMSSRRLPTQLGPETKLGSQSYSRKQQNRQKQLENFVGFSYRQSMVFLLVFSGSSFFL